MSQSAEIFMLEDEAERSGIQSSGLTQAEILDLLDNNGLTAWFQPVFSR